MSDADPRDEGTWLDDMPIPRRPLLDPRQAGRTARAVAELAALGDGAVLVARTASRADEDARAAVRRIGVER